MVPEEYYDNNSYFEIAMLLCFLAAGALYWWTSRRNTDREIMHLDPYYWRDEVEEVVDRHYVRIDQAVSWMTLLRPTAERIGDFEALRREEEAWLDEDTDDQSTDAEQGDRQNQYNQ